MRPVRPKRIATAKEFGLHNVDVAAMACRQAGLPFWAACTLLEKESGGRNVYGNDAGGALSGFPFAVTLDNYRVFRWLIDKGHRSNGVGPTQITWAPYFTEMDRRGLQPWVPYDNMVFGFGLLADYRKAKPTWAAAAAAYNGSTAYGSDFVTKGNEWRARLGTKGKIS